MKTVEAGASRMGARDIPDDYSIVQNATFPAKLVE